MTNRDEGNDKQRDEELAQQQVRPGTTIDPRAVSGPDFGDVGGVSDLADVDESAEALTIAASLNAQTMRTLLSNRNFIPTGRGKQWSCHSGVGYFQCRSLNISGPRRRRPGRSA